MSYKGHKEIELNLGPFGSDAPLNILKLEINEDLKTKLASCVVNNNLDFTFKIHSPDDYEVSHTASEYNPYHKILKYYPKAHEWK